MEELQTEQKTIHVTAPWKITLLVILDVLLIGFAAIAAYWMTTWGLFHRLTMNWTVGLWAFGNVLLMIALLVSFGLYTLIFATVGFPEAIRIIASVLISAVVNIAFVLRGGRDAEIGFTVVLFYSLLILLWLFFSRFAKRGIMAIYTLIVSNATKKTRVLIVGCNNDAFTLIRNMVFNEKSRYKAVGIIEDDSRFLGKRIYDVRVVGTTYNIKEVVKKYNAQEIFVAIPSETKAAQREMLQRCKDCGCPLRLLPELSKMTHGEITVSKLRPVEIEDLLGREQISTNLNEVMGYIEGQTVLVTGGGGSIGSELCRQIALHNPAELIILDIYENSVYDIEYELRSHYPDLKLLTLIASIRDEGKVEDVFQKYRPQIVFNAAAHKHVPLMETSPNEAVKNNVGGTYNVAQAAGKFGAKRFVLISTDKAVNPTNVMGATKRICEMIVQAMNKKYQTEYVAVRFGNVLGSNGSVIPLFKKQIKEGGPVTVTHKDIVRYFMTIPEAVSLVLQAGAYAEGGEIFVLDMGDPVKIYDLAVNMIRLSGFEPFKDIDVKVTGLRPGEKLYEERLMEEEGLKKTENEKISIGKPLDIDEKKLFSRIELLVKQAEEETESMKDLVSELVPTYVIDRK